MKIIPAIDIFNGRCVRLLKGDYAKVSEYNQCPIDQVKIFKNAGFDYIHIIDLNAAKSGGNENLEIIKEICKLDNINIQVGGGIRSIKKINNLSFKILQAARVRVTSTDFISCPSCGRTLFDLQETTAMIRERTDHLKGLKIGIMGCIVNGPGEMADADYGYVGSGVDKITLYRGQEVVKRGINFKYGVDELVNLIKEDGNWIEP